ncbi:MAG: hypothetical protein ACJ8C4_20515 [Gemmataceae bacterium]
MVEFLAGEDVRSPLLIVFGLPRRDKTGGSQLQFSTSAQGCLGKMRAGVSVLVVVGESSASSRSPSSSELSIKKLTKLAALCLKGGFAGRAVEIGRPVVACGGGSSGGVRRATTAIGHFPSHLK